MSLQLDRPFDGPPAVLMGGGLDLLRPLGRARIPVVVATADPESAGLASRYTVGRVMLPGGGPEAAAEALILAGEELARRAGRPLPLVYGNDDHLALLYRYQERLSRSFLFLLNEPALGRALLQKDRFAALAKEHGLPVPAALAWGEEVARWPGPVLIKPRSTEDWEATPLRELFVGSEKAVVFERGAALLAHEAAARFKDQLTVQEYVPGDDSQIVSFHGFAGREGDLLGSFTGRKLRTFPPMTGESCFLELTRDDQVEEVGRDILARLRLRGPFKMDLKRDPRSGRLYLFEINARFNLWHYMGAVNGVNLPALAYHYLLEGRATPTARHRTTYRWLYLRVDYRAFRGLRAKGELTTLAWLRSLLCLKVHHVFSWRDPAPFLRRFTGGLARRLTRWRSTGS